MLLAFLVYSFILIFVVFWGVVLKRKKALVTITNIHVWIPVIIISIIAGLRYDVGTDWENYRRFYEHIATYGGSWNGMQESLMEPFYYLLNCFIAFWNMPYQFLFLTVMAAHLIFLYISFNKFIWLLPLGLFFYFTLIFAMSLNIHRQTLAFCIFLYAIKYYLKGNFIKYAACVCVASCFHYSSLILFFVYVLRYKYFSFMDKRWVCLLLYFCSFYLFEYAFSIIVSFLELYVTNMKYLNNISSLGNADMDVSSGLGIFLYHILDICIIWNSKRLSHVFNEVHLNLIFRLFLVGVVFSNMFGNDVFLSRVPLALESLRFLMLSFLVYDLVRSKTVFNYMCGILICLICTSMFFMGILNGNSGCSPFQFF